MAGRFLIDFRSHANEQEVKPSAWELAGADRSSAHSENGENDRRPFVNQQRPTFLQKIFIFQIKKKQKTTEHVARKLKSKNAKFKIPPSCRHLLNLSTSLS